MSRGGGEGRPAERRRLPTRRRTRLSALPRLFLFLQPQPQPPPSSPSPSPTSIMFARSAARTLTSQARTFSSSAARQTKVAVLGAGGGIGQPLSLLLKIDPLVTSLSLYDIRGAPGVAADVSHIDSAGEVRRVSRLGVAVTWRAKALRLRALARTGQGLRCGPARPGPRGRQGRRYPRRCPKEGSLSPFAFFCAPRLIFFPFQPGVSLPSRSPPRVHSNSTAR